jgi:histidyl-tRNA synthetase
LDKIGEAKVVEEMLSKGISQEGIDQLKPIFTLSGDFESQITQLERILSTSEEGLKGIQELQFINQGINAVDLQSATLNLNVTLARGLNYYTGAIFEVAAPEGVQMGSIGGGGRYDDLTGIFGLKGMSGVGISLGLDRIYLVLEELNLFPDTVAKVLDVLFVNFGQTEAFYALQAIQSLRAQGISCELYPDAAKLKKQLNYANKRGVRFVIMAGDQEIANHTFTVKDMGAGTQETLSLDGLLELFN